MRNNYHQYQISQQSQQQQSLGSNHHYQQQQIQPSQDSLSKISRSKSKQQIIMVQKLKQKQNKWNDRFHLGQIPQYNYQNQPHSQYLRNKFRLPQKIFFISKQELSKAKRYNQQSLEKNKVSNKPNPRRTQERQKQAINKAYMDLKTLWYQRNIPECHMQIMTKILNRENNPIKILDEIKKQFSQINKDISLVQKIMSSIETRQKTMQKIQQIIQMQNINGQNCKLFEEKIFHLRVQTIHCIQCIYQWKQSIQPFGFKKSIQLIYLYDKKSYLTKIINDYKQIINSNITKFYKFDLKKNDVFFVGYTFEGKKISNISKNLLKRIRMCQKLLQQDSSNNNNNNNNNDSINNNNNSIYNENNQRQNKRIPIIKKQISPLINRKDLSMPPKYNNNNNNNNNVNVNVNKIAAILWKKIIIDYGQIQDYFLKSMKKSVFNKSFLDIIDLLKYQQITIFQNIQLGDEIFLGIDKNSSQRKIQILGMNSTLDKIENLFSNLCQFLWQNDTCNEIKISLIHYQKNQKLQIDIELSKKIKILGFKWLSINQNNDIRMTIFGMKRPLNLIANKINIEHKQHYPVIIQHLTIFNLLENNEKKTPNMCLTSVLGLLEYIKQNNKKQLYEQLCRRDEFAYYFQCIGKINQFLQKQAKKQNNNHFEKYFTYSGQKSFQIQHQEKLNKIFNNVQIKFTNSNSNNYQFPYYISLLNTSFKYQHTTINDGKYTKFFPGKDYQILICQSNYPIYLLQTDQENISFFIIEVQDNFSMQSIDNIFHAMGNQSSFIDQFWLPNFYKNHNYIDQIDFKNRELISTNYHTFLGSLTRKSKSRTKIIKAPFVFGMINKKLLEMLEVPFYCTLIKKQNLL